MKTTVRVSDELWVRVRTKALREGVAVTEVIEQLLEGWESGRQPAGKSVASVTPVASTPRPRDPTPLPAETEIAQRRQTALAALAAIETKFGLREPEDDDPDEDEAWVYCKGQRGAVCVEAECQNPVHGPWYERHKP